MSAVLDYLKVKYPKAQIELPELYLNAFDEAGWDYSGIPRQKWKRYELYAKLRSSYVAIAQVNSGLHIEVRDVLRQKEIATADVPFSPSSHKSFVGNWVKSQLLGMTPNAINLRQTQATASGFASLQNSNQDPNISNYAFYTVSSSPESYRPSQEWGVLLTNVEPSLGRRFAFVAKWATEFSLGRSTLYVTESAYKFNFLTLQSNNSTTNVGQVNKYFLGAGIGPEVGIVGAFGYLYLNLIYSAEAAYFDFSNDVTNLTEVYSPMKVGFGYKLRLTDQFHLGAEIGIRSTPTWVHSKMLSQMNQQEISSSFANEATVAFSLSYYFPEMKFFGVRKLKNAMAVN